MRHSSRTRPFLLLFSLAITVATSAYAQDPLSAKDALAAVARTHGPASTAAIVEMTGTFGQDQPEKWSLISWDERSVFNLRNYQIERGEVIDGGDDYARHYPDNPPTGFVPIAKLKIDSTLAFEIAEKEARRARMGFNSLNYRLAAMEYATEPVWTLDLIDADENLAGKIYLSGETGEVLRTLFFYRNDPLKIRIVDSAAPRAEELSTQAPATTQAPAAATDDRVTVGAPQEGTMSEPALPPMPDLSGPANPPLDDSVAPPPTPTTPPAPVTPPTPPAPTPGGDRFIPPPPIPQ